MKIRILIFLLVFSLTSPFSQENFFLNNFSSNKYLPELLTKSNIGCYVKGDILEIKSNCEIHNATYFDEVKNWHYIRISPSKINSFIRDEKHSSNFMYQRIEVK